MQITVFGASGKVGRLVVAALSAQGHSVVAFIHHSNPFQDDATVRTVSGDIYNASTVENAVHGSDAVISTLGSWGTPTKSVVGAGTELIVAAMKKNQILRLITLTGGGALTSTDRPGLSDRLTRRLLEVVAPKILSDGERHIRILEGSDLDWTCIRSPAMTGKGGSAYILNMKLPSLFALIPRAAVVACIVDQINEQAFIGQAPVIHHV